MSLRISSVQLMDMIILTPELITSFVSHTRTFRTGCSASTIQIYRRLLLFGGADQANAVIFLSFNSDLSFVPLQVTCWLAFCRFNDNILLCVASLCSELFSSLFFFLSPPVDMQ